MANFTLLNNKEIKIGKSLNLDQVENLKISGVRKGKSKVTFLDVGGEGRTTNVKLGNVIIGRLKLPKKLKQLQITNSEISKGGPQLSGEIGEIIIENTVIDSIFDLGLNKFDGIGVFKNNKIISSCQTKENKDETCFIDSNLDFSNNFINCRCVNNGCNEGKK